MEPFGPMKLLIGSSALLGLLLLSPLMSLAGEEIVNSPPRWARSWDPAATSNPGGWDWLRTSSNEWIKGELLLMRDFDLQFDSDEFGIVTIEWEDVASLYTERPYTAVLEDMRTAHVGTIVVHENEVAVNTGDGVERFPRSRLLAITPSAERESNLWSIRAVLGASLRSGNTDLREVSARLNAGRESRNTHFTLGYNGAYSTLDGDKNTNNHRGRTGLDAFITRDFFASPYSVEVFSDEFQNVAYRVTEVTGAGYYLFREPAYEWQARLGVGHQHTRVDSAEAGKGKDSDNAAFVFDTLLNADITSDVELTLRYQLQAIVPDTNETNHHGEAILEIELTSMIDLDVSFIWDRIEKPQRANDGIRPKSNDFRTSIGLAIEY